MIAVLRRCRCPVSMDRGTACMICQERTHRASRCPCLHDPLKEGFYSGGGGGGGHSHDDDEERARHTAYQKLEAVPPPVRLLQELTQKTC